MIIALFMEIMYILWRHGEQNFTYRFVLQSFRDVGLQLVALEAANDDDDSRDMAHQERM